MSNKTRRATMAGVGRELWPIGVFFPKGPASAFLERDPHEGARSTSGASSQKAHRNGLGASLIFGRTEAIRRQCVDQSPGPRHRAAIAISVAGNYAD